MKNDDTKKKDSNIHLSTSDPELYCFSLQKPTLDVETFSKSESETTPDFCSIFSKSGCTYHTDEVFLETDQVTEKEKDFIRNCIYRQELLNMFGLEELDENKMEEVIAELFQKMKYQQDFYSILEILNEKYSLSKEDCFLLLFSFDYLHMTHLCICDYLESGKIDCEHIIPLVSAIGV